MRGQFVSKPLVHFLPGVNITACGVLTAKPRYADGLLPSTTAAWAMVTCWSCERTIAWKKARQELIDEDEAEVQAHEKLRMEIEAE